jgi:outer membrane protein assembly factor BamE (lipoprotein component of BamABCDE complex)
MQRCPCSRATWVAILALAACSSPPPPDAEKIAVGAVQREIKVGMDQPSVLKVLGPPNRVSTDSERREMWTYDQISSDRIDTTSSIGGSIRILGGANGSAASAADPRTLTLIIYYDEQNKVRNFAYNYSPP